MSERNTSPLITDFPIEINGKQFMLAYPIAALWAYEDATGVDLFKNDPRSPEEIVAEAMQRPPRKRMEETVALLWAGLRTHQPELKLADVQAMVFLKDLPAIEKIVVDAYKASLPQDTAAEGDADPLATSQPN